MLTWHDFRRADVLRRRRRGRHGRIALAVLAAGLAGSCSLAGEAPRLALATADRPAPSAPVAAGSPPAVPTALSAEMIADLANVSVPSSASPDASGVAPVLSGFAGPAARAFGVAGRGGVERVRAHLCLASALYYEADSESDDGERAVAQVVLNRVRHPAFPASVCGVVYQGSENPSRCQFSFACDGSMARRRVSGPGWARASRIADAALAGAVFAPVGLAINYHTVSVAPRWSSLLVPAAVIGRHIFYRLTGPAGSPTAFGQAYARAEPMPGPHAQVAAVASTAAVTALASVFPIVAERAASQPVAPPEETVAASPTVTPDNQILPRWRDSGRWIGH